MKKLTKIAVGDFPLVESAKTIEEYGASVWGTLFSLCEDHASPPVDYWLAGDIIGEVLVGQSLTMYRHVRNGVKIEGWFQTSPVREIIKNSENELIGISTGNSVYRIEDYDDAIS
jgi:hypothetical protein